jgi:hypothetical protein
MSVAIAKKTNRKGTSTTPTHKAKAAAPKAVTEATSKGKGKGVDIHPSHILTNIFNYAETLEASADQLAGVLAIFQPFTDNNDPLPSHLVWAARSIIELAEESLREAQKYIAENSSAMNMALINPEAEAALRASMESADDENVRREWHARRREMDDASRVAEWTNQKASKAAASSSPTDKAAAIARVVEVLNRRDWVFAGRLADLIAADEKAARA